MIAEPLDSIYHFDSYVLPLFEPADIAKVRELIQTGQQQIVFAAIAPGADGINRNVYHDQLWSWHVTQFEGFGDIGIELLDGWPTYVESDVPGLDGQHRRPYWLLELHGHRRTAGRAGAVDIGLGRDRRNYTDRDRVAPQRSVTRKSAAEERGLSGAIKMGAGRGEANYNGTKRNRPSNLRHLRNLRITPPVNAG